MARRKLVAGNWKMNGLAASAAVLDELAARAIPPRLRRADLPARDADLPARRPRLPARRPGLPLGALRRPYRRHRRRDADRRRRGRGDRRPFRAPQPTTARPTRSSRARPPPPGGPASSPSSASARPRPSATPARPSTASARSSPGRSPTAPPRDAARRRLRAGLGDRHRPHPIPERDRRSPCLHSRNADARFGHGDRRGDPPALRRLGEARQRRRDLRRRRTSTARWSAAPR